MWHKIIIVLICAAVSGVLYRLGGSGIFKGSIAVRRYGCQIPALTAFWFLGLHAGAWYRVLGVYLLTYGAMAGALSTYFDFLSPRDKDVNSLCWAITGLVYGLSCIGFIWLGVPWWIILTRAMVLGALTMAWSDHTHWNTTVEECGRGFLFVI